MSIQDIQQNPQDTSNFYLANIYQAVADPNRPNISASLPTAPPPFSPPNYAVWVNSLWFMSLVISITCALLATLLQQWARRYLKVTRTRHSLHKRARLRSFFAEGVEKSLLPLAVEALPTLVHASLFLFFAGMVVFLWNVNLTVFKSVLSWISFCTVLYGCITLVQILRPDSPYYTPLTPIARLVIAAILCAIAVPSLCFGTMFFVFSLCSCCLGPYRIFGFLINWLDHVWDMTFLMPAEAALKSTSEIDTRALLWTFDRLDEDHELEHFFSGLPGFHSSKVVKEPLRGLRDDQKIQLSTAMVRLLDRTFSSDLLPDRVKHRRGDICANAIDLIDTPKAFPEILRRLASEDGYGPVNSAEIGRFLRRWDYREGEDTTVVQALFSIIVARVQQQDDSWFILASDLLGVPETDLRSHAAHSSDLSLAILIYITRQQLNYFQNPSWPLGAISDVLGAASKFKVQDTSPVLQHEFCALWNQVARKAQHDSNWAITNRILKPIRNVYLTLHHNTSSAPTRFNASTSEQDGILELESSYPVCNIVGHIHNNSASTAAAQTVLLDDAAWSPPSFPSPAAPFHADEILTTVPLLDDSHTIHQTLERFPIPATSPDQATSAGGIQHIVASSIMTPYPTPEISTSVHPRFFTSQPTAVSLQYSADPLTPSDSLNLPSPTSNPVLDNLPPTGPSLSRHSRITRSDLVAFPRFSPPDNSYQCTQCFSKADLWASSRYCRPR